MASAKPPKKIRQQIWVVIGLTDYQPSTFLGVYSSSANAEIATEMFKEDSKFDEYSTTVASLDEVVVEYTERVYKKKSRFLDKE